MSVDRRLREIDLLSISNKNTGYPWTVYMWKKWTYVLGTLGFQKESSDSAIFDLQWVSCEIEVIFKIL